MIIRHASAEGIRDTLLTLTDTDDTVRRERGLVVIHIHDVNTQGRGPRQLWRSFIRGNDCEAVSVPDLPVQYDVGLHQTREWRLNYECVVMVTIDDVV